MAEDLSAKIDWEWEQLQFATLRLANVLMKNLKVSPAEKKVDGMIDLPPVYGQIIAAVIGTFSPAPLGVDDFLGAFAVANANAGEDEPDAVKSPPVFDTGGKS